MTDFPVANNTDFNAAVLKAQPGDRIVMAAGGYAAIKVNRRFIAPGVVVEAAPGASVQFAGVTTDAITIDSGAGWTFRNLTAITNRIGFMVGGRSARIHILNCEVHGDLTSPISAKSGSGIAFKSATDCSAEGNEIHHTSGGVRMSTGCAGIRVAGNSIHHCRGDAIAEAGTQGLVIEGNTIESLFPADTDHCDGIQILSAGEEKSTSNCLIRRNSITRGESPPTARIQGIFANAENGQPYSNITIEENLVTTGHYHGITMTLAPGVTIRNNVVAAHVGDYGTGWIKATNCVGAVVEGNFSTGGVIGEGSTTFATNSNSLITIQPKNDDTLPLKLWHAVLDPKPDPVAELAAALDRIAKFKAALTAALDLL